MPASRAYFYFTGLLLICLLTFVLQTVFFDSTARPDEYKAIDYFVVLVSGFEVQPITEAWTRLLFTAFNLCLVAVLYSVRLIDARTLVFALIWPLTFFLFSKIYWEFFVFPLCLVRLDLRARHEFLFILALGLVLIISGEANIGVFIVFRLVLFMQKIGLTYTMPIGVFVFGILLDLAMRTGVANALPVIGPLIRRFAWTREVANPDYTPVETLMVFAASFHFFSLHTGAFWIDALFSLMVIFVIANNREAIGNARQNFPLILAFFSVVFFFTHVTYAFQNARYYFFYMPILALIVPPRVLPPLAVLGVLHVVFRSMSL